jgi:hypothetical protein
MRLKTKSRVVLSRANSAMLGKLRAGRARRYAQLGDCAPKNGAPQGRRQNAAARELSSEIEVGGCANRKLATTKFRLFSRGGAVSFQGPHVSASSARIQAPELSPRWRPKPLGLSAQKVLPVYCRLVSQQLVWVAIGGTIWREIFRTNSSRPARSDYVIDFIPHSPLHIPH